MSVLLHKYKTSMHRMNQDDYGSYAKKPEN